MYNEKLADKVREYLVDIPNVTEKKMFQGLCFMVNDKMCICVRDEKLLCRIEPEKVDELLEKGNSSPMIHNGKKMKGYVFVDENGYKNKKDFDSWIQLCLDYNPIAKSSKRKKN